MSDTASEARDGKTIASAWKRDPRIGISREVRQCTGLERKFWVHLLNAYDWDAYVAIQQKHRALKSRWRKSLDVTDYAKRRFQLALSLGLASCPPLRILDLGCGPSHFALVATFLGHDVVGLDIPGEAVFDDVNAFFGTPRVIHTISAREPLPALGGPFDLIMSVSASFHRKPEGTLFDAGDWQFLLNDLRNHGVATCRIDLGVNPLRKSPGPHLDHPTLVEALVGFGAQVDAATSRVSMMR